MFLFFVYPDACDVVVCWGCGCCEEGPRKRMNEKRCDGGDKWLTEQRQKKKSFLSLRSAEK